MRRIIIPILILLFAFSVLAKTSDLPDSGPTLNSPFYFLKAWKESIQTFFTLGAEAVKKGIENAIKSLKKQSENILKKRRERVCQNFCGDGICQTVNCMAVGCSCPETKESCPADCKADTQTVDLMACETDGDCACGVHLGKEGTCFFGNKKYVNTSVQCPDFCSGIDGKMRIRCINNKCTQIRP